MEGERSPGRRRVIPPYIYCPKCGGKLELAEETRPEALEKLMSHGFTAAARGICGCGVVALLCYRPLPASPTFSLFFDVYAPEALREILIASQNKTIS